MTRRKAVTAILAALGVVGLTLVLVMLPKPAPAASYASYAWKPGCHCRPATPTTIVKPPATTKPKTTTTAKPTATTAKPATTTTKAAGATASAAGTASTAAAGIVIPGNRTTSSTAAKTSAKTGKASTASSSKSKKTTKSRKTTTTAVVLAAAASGSGSPADANATGSATSDLINAGSMPPLPHYFISPVAIAFILLYGASFVLYRSKRIRVATHRKTWNLMLLGTFLICGLLGLVLAVGLTRPTPWEFPTWLKVWHVETGIVMCLISVFHIGWHARYYLALVTGKRKPERASTRPAVERASRPAAAERRASGQPAVQSAVRQGVRPRSDYREPSRGQPRTEADRVYAFEMREARRRNPAAAKS